MSQHPRDESDTATLLETVRQYQIDLGNETTDTVVTMFLEDFSCHLESLQVAIAVDDVQTIKRTAHKLKGSCAQMGDHPSVALCLELETASFSEMGTPPTTLERLRRRFEVVSSALGGGN